MSASSNENVLGFTDEDFPDSAHICLVFDDEDERRKIVSKYLKAGLQRGEQIRYMADTASPDEVRAWLLQMGVEIPDERPDGPFLILEAQKFYTPGGRFEPEAMIGRMLPRLDASKQAGYRGSRVTGEMSWALRGAAGSDHLLEYEAMLTAVSHPFPHMGMCQYDARRWDGATLFRVLQVHPYMVAQGHIVRNPFFTRPEEMLVHGEG